MHRINSLSSQKVKDYISSKGCPVLEDELLKLKGTTRFNIELHLKKLVREGKIGKKTFGGPNEEQDITIYWILNTQKKENEPEPVSKKQRPSEEDLDKQIEELGWVEETFERDVGSHINRLHLYNETKDVAQELIGKIANIEGRTVKEIYPNYGLEEED